MDVTTKQWLTILVIVVIVGIFLDGFRRMRKARRDSLTMSLDPKKDSSLDIGDRQYGSEFPNGGARTSERQIDRDRIAKARSQYDFGTDMTNLKKDRIRDEERKKDQEHDEDIESDYSHDQWVDSDEGDEDYYGKKWDDEYEGDYSDDDTEHSVEEGSDEAPVVDEVPVIDEVAETLEDDIPQTGAVPSLGAIDQISDDVDPITTEHEELEANKPEAVELEEVDDVFADDFSELEDQPVQHTSATTKNSASNKDNEKPARASRDEAAYVEPEQASLNLEDTVPVLMETTETPEKQPVEPQLSDSDDVLLEEADDSDVEIRPVGKRIRKNIEPVIGDEQELDTRSANKPRYESKYFSNATKSSAPKDENRLEEVLILHIRARGDQAFDGADLLHAALQQGMRYGAMDIFHFHTDEDGEGPVLFSMANMLMPGVFDLKTIDEFTTIGVTFFMTMPVVDNNNLAVFDQMITTAKAIAAELDGELKDEQRSVMTAQTIEHYRERIRDFARKQQLQKNK